MPSETALVLAFPELSALLDGVRGRYDPSAARGAPPHITLLYPWMASPRSVDIDAVRRIAAGFPSLGITLTSTGRFERTLYLVPEDGGETAALVAAIHRRFAELRPYGGRVGSFVPHLTVANDRDDIEAIAASELAALLQALPITLDVRAVSLLQSDEAGQWRMAGCFPFGD